MHRHRMWFALAAVVLIGTALLIGTMGPGPAMAQPAASPLPGALAGQSLVAQFGPQELAGSAWNPSNRPGNCPTANNGAFVNGAGYAQIDTSGATGDCRAMQSPKASLPTAPGYTYEALLNFSSFHDWPAFWMYGPNWPAQGEIDAVEGGPGSSYVTWHQAGNYTVGPDPWDSRQVPYAGFSHDIQPGTWTTVDISFTKTGVDVYYDGALYVHIPETVTTSGGDPMYLTISEGSCDAGSVSVCGSGGPSPAGSVQARWVREFGPGPVPIPAPTPAGTCTATAPATAPAGGFAAYVRGRYAVPAWNLVDAVAPQYEIRVYLPDGSLWHDSVVDKSSATYSPVPAYGTYRYQVRARNCAGPGPWSGMESFTVTR